jgi:DNA-binding MarR family transcriptional regulator
MTIPDKFTLVLHDWSEMLGVTNAAASQMVDRLVQYEMIERSEDPVDRRVKQLKLTEKGRGIVQESIEARRRWMEKLTNALTHDDQISIITALTILTNAAHDLEPVKNQVGEFDERDLTKKNISLPN